MNVKNEILIDGAEEQNFFSMMSGPVFQNKLDSTNSINDEIHQDMLDKAKTKTQFRKIRCQRGARSSEVPRLNKRSDPLVNDLWKEKNQDPQSF